MARRKLNKQQRERIAGKHSATLDNIGQCLQGIVTAHHGGEVEIVAIDSSAVATAPAVPYRCHVRANLPAIVCGDRVLWRAAATHDASEADSAAPTGIVEALQPRLTVIHRPRPHGGPKPVAANIDLILLVLAAQPEPVINLIDRYLVAAENAGIAAALLVNKTDLLNDAAHAPRLAEIKQLAQLYAELGYPVYQYQANPDACDSNACNAIAAAKFDPATVLANKTTILVGQSGVGKSSIINKLCTSAAAATGDVSSANRKGRHTTTNAQLYFLGRNQYSDQGAIIDSPGIREFALWHLSQEDIIDGMPELRRFASQCRFRDCQHGKTAGCALQQAFDQGLVPASRIASYRHILESQNQ